MALISLTLLIIGLRTLSEKFEEYKVTTLINLDENMLYEMLDLIQNY